MASIEEKGLLQPIVVRPVGDGFEVVAGNRRLEACRMLKMSRIPSHIIELDDREAYEASLIENVQHRTLEPIEEAEAFKRYVDEYGWGGVSELARRIGKCVQYVSSRIHLLSLPQEVQDRISRRREITPSVAQELTSLSDPSMQKMLSEVIVEERLTRREVRHIIRRMEEGHESEPLVSYYSLEEKRQHMIDRALKKYIASMKVCMTRLDDALDHVDEDEWLVRELLIQHRAFIHLSIDNLLKLKKKIHRVPRLE